MKYSIFSVALTAWLGWGAKNSTPATYPSHFPAPLYDFEAMPFDTAKAALGRLLFYDPILSKDNSISCASCHSPYHAFAHTDHTLSHGINDAIGTRNAPPLFNLPWQGSFMWDGAIHHLDVQALAPISAPNEMGASLELVLERLQQQPRYVTRFAQAFGDSLITGAAILQGQTIAYFDVETLYAGTYWIHIGSGDAVLTRKVVIGR